MRYLFFLGFVWGMLPVIAQGNSARQQYIDKYAKLAMKNMVEYKIPASITLAQGCLESGNGNSELARKSNNHFGIKCHSSWTGKRTYHDDDKKQECFRVYDDVYDSYADHSKFLQKPRYAKCFELKITDYKSWAKELKRAGYATNPKYPDLLIKIIEENELWRYDEQVMKHGLPKGEDMVVEKPDYQPNAAGSFELGVIDMHGSFAVRKSENDIKFIEAKGGESVEQLARTLEMGPWQIKRYNNVSKTHTFQAGDVVYLQPKRNKAKEEFHVVKPGETLESISQEYGIKHRAILRKNRLPKDAILQPGTKLWLRKRKPAQP
jgi:LysM repeat protein